MKLTANITLDELTKSQVAERKGINNNPNPAQIENLVTKLQKPKDCEIKLVYEKKLLGTAGTLINNINFFENDDCLLLHCDNYTTDDLKKFVLSKNDISNWEIKMFTFKTKNFSSSGIVKVNKNNIVTEFYEKDNVFRGDLANGAIYIIKNTILNDIKNTKYYDFAKEVIPKYLNKILIYETKDFFIDIGNINSLNEANNYVLKNSEKK